MKSLAVLLAGATLAAGASAASLSFDFTRPLEVTEIDQTGVLGLFDTNLGTLTGVTLSFNGKNATALTLRNTAAQDQTTRATSTTDLFFDSSSLAPLNGLIQAANPIMSLSATTGFVTLAPGELRAFGPLTDEETVTWTSQLAGILSSFQQAGGGNFDLGCESLSGLQVLGGGGNIASTQRTEAACSAQIVYTYEERQVVPEPGALALVGIALAGLSLTRRKTAKA